MGTDDPGFYSLSQAQRVLGVTEAELNLLVSEGDVSALRRGSEMIFRRLEVDSYARSFYSFDQTKDRLGIDAARLMRLVTEGDIHLYRDGVEMTFKRSEVDIMAGARRAPAGEWPVDAATEEGEPENDRSPGGAPEPSRPGAASVFLSAKSEDYDHAARVYEFLAARRLSVFFSPRSLHRLGSAYYQQKIDEALDEADHLVVVTSSGEHARSRWVEAEWRLFLNEIRAGRKQGNIVTVAVGNLPPERLPLSLRSYEVIPLSDEGLERLLGFLGPVRDP